MIEREATFYCNNRKMQTAAADDVSFRISYFVMRFFLCAGFRQRDGMEQLV